MPHLEACLRLATLQCSVRSTFLSHTLRPVTDPINRPSQAPFHMWRLPVATPWSQESTQVIEGLGSTTGGITTADATRRLTQYGPNKLPEPKKTPWLIRLLGHMKNVIIIILLLAAAAKFALAQWVDGWVLVIVVAVTVGIGMIQEGRAEKSLDAIKKMLSLSALTLRDGNWGEVDAENLVPGDIIRIKAGDRVPADARLMEATNLQIEEAALTGESVAAEKTVDPLAEDAGLGDRTNMLFSSTIVVAGTGTAVITGTGANTEIGHIQDLIAQADHEITPLARTMDRFGKRIAVIVLAAAAVMAAVGFFVHNQGGTLVLSNAIGVAAAAIPEGLSAVVTIALALGVKALAQRNSISRNLTSTETLGSVSTICSDKTGTLTQNEMTVREVRTRTFEYHVDGSGYAPIGEISHNGTDHSITPELVSLAEITVLCNDAIIAQDDAGLWQLTGEPTEGAMLSLGNKAGFTGEGWNRIAEIPFDSATKYMATLTQDPQGGRHIFVKGALGQVLERCSQQWGINGVEDVDGSFWRGEMEKMASQGLRVLGVARADVSADTAELPADGPRNLVFVGIVGIVDPPRPEAIHSIAEAHAAGIAVKMITGDHVITAKAIAQEMGITSGEANALTGPQLEAMSDDDLAAVVKDTHVFARVSPEHKIRIVRALQRHGEIVAMTGDGVNDAPALSQANVGVAMGIKGTEATKAAADLVLLDDNFSTIEKAIFEGRRVYDNIRKCTMFALPANVAQASAILFATFLGWAFTPLSAVQILWVNMVVAVCLDLTFAAEPGEKGLMRRRPRNQDESLITVRYSRHIFLFGFVIAGAMLLMVFHEIRYFGGDSALRAFFNPNVDFAPYAHIMPQVQSAALTMIMMAQLAHVFNVRRINSHSFTTEVLKGNKVLAISLVILAAAHIFLTYTPFMQSSFGIAATSLRQWAMILPMAVGVFLVIELLKFLFKLGEDKADAKAQAKREANLALLDLEAVK